ncbi:MAG: multicopper oxidase family protein [Polyangiaceae bacterium]
MSGIKRLGGSVVALFVLFTCAAGCSSKSKTDEATKPAANGADAGGPTMPTVWGVDEFVDENPDPKIVEVHLEAAASTTTDYQSGATTKIVTYNGTVPGPLLQAHVGDEIIVHFTNHHSAPTTIHWHGLRISDDMDGSPRIQQPIPPGGEFTYRFKAPDPGTFWYHPHVHANEQVEDGMYGTIVIRGDKEPTYDRERYLVLDDVLLDDKGQIAVQPFQSGMNAMHGRYGNVLLTNGKESTRVRGEAKAGEVERWRIVNTANARTMTVGITGAKFKVIGTDGGLLPESYTTTRLDVPVGARFDLEVTYDAPGTAKLVNYIPTQNAKGDIVDQPVNALQVDVGEGGAPREIERPTVDALPARSPSKNVTIEINAIQTSLGQIQWQLNGMSNMDAPLFTFKKGETVRVKLVNKVGPEHPFHLHGQFFTIKDAKLPGLKDVVLVPGMSTVEIDAYFDNPGRWMAHCHNLEHSELGMMSEIVVEP